LPLRQEQVTLTGHAIEARLYAEDAHGDFLPQAGTLLAWRPPVGPGVRVDHGIAPGLAISPFYDPMMAKIIAHGSTREEARRRLIAALEDTVALGIDTNRHFLIDCLSHPAFAAGETSTAFIERHFPPAARARPVPDGRMIALAAAMIDERERLRASEMLSHWRSSGFAASPLRLKSGDGISALEIVRLDASRYRVGHAGDDREVDILRLDGDTVRFLGDGIEESAQFVWEDDILHLSVGGVTASFEDVQLAGRAAASGAAAGSALAPMTGTISAVRVKAGDAVRKGQCLVILEAMKMEHEILAPRDGTVAAVLVAQGEQVATRKLLVELVPQAAE
ncbi:MAG TPA: biotin/lipoyl-containing protein, partial [Stellaceae bacterium]|nr:biotin/lipoyl-containing protein [Stellaceae bacterium]